MKRTVTFLSSLLLLATLLAMPGCDPAAEPEVGSQTASPATADPAASESSAELQVPEQFEPPVEGSEELLILSGNSFGPPVEKLAKMFEKKTGIKSAISYGGSEDLLPQVKIGKTGDVFITHTPYMQYAKDANAMLRWIHVGYVAPVLVVRKGNPKKLAKFEDLAKPGIQVLLPNPEFSTCGEMVFTLLEKKGIKAPVLKNVGNAMFRSHGDIGAKMKLEAGDAAMMWNGVAHTFLDAVDIIPTEYEYENEIQVGVIGLSYTEKKDLVEQFLKFVEEEGKAVFQEFGYVK